MIKKYLKFLPLLFIATLAHATSNMGYVFGNGTNAAAPFTATPLINIMNKSGSGLGTGVAAAAANPVNTASGFITYNGALGTPTSVVLTNATGLPVSTGLIGLGTGVAAAAANAVNGNNGLVQLTSSGTLPIGLSSTVYGTGVAAVIVNPLNAANGLVGYSLIGTSGATIPLNNGNDTVSGNNTYSGNSIFSGTVTLPAGTVATNLGYNPANVANNLSDLVSASSARTNLGLLGLATVVPGTGVVTAAADAVDTTGGFGTIGTSGATVCLSNANCTFSGTELFSGRIKLADQGSCTMTSGACSAQSLSSTYGTAPICVATWTGTGTLAGSIKITSNATTVTPSSSGGSDTAVVNWVCYGN